MVIDEVWRGLFANLAAVALFMAIWSQSLLWLDARPRMVRSILTGVMIGLGAVATMTLPVQLGPGLFFDLRMAVIAVGSLFGGPLVAMVSVAVACAYRVALGGQGAMIGIVVIVLASVLGLVARGLSGPNHPRSIAIVGLGFAVGAVNAGVWAFLPNAFKVRAFEDFALPAATLGVVGTLLIGFTMLHARVAARERFILRTAFAQAPDFQYVKDRNSAFIAANVAVARHNGFATPAEMVGKTDFDLFPPAHARQLLAAEQEIMRTGVGMVDFEETLTDAEGRERWFRSSKAPLHDTDGRIVGLAGVTVDFTAQKQLERELQYSRHIVQLALSEMRDALVLFDRDARLVFCNAEYLRMFNLTADVRQPGAHLRDVLGAMASTGEQVNVPDDVEGWIAGMVTGLFFEDEKLLEMHDGRFLLRRNRPVADGCALVVFSDVTELKRAERALRAANAELQVQATTDGLTGLANRRAFDELISREVDRSARERRPLSFLLIDVDRFKAYNDIYGHLAGDDCLRMIAQCLRAAIHRPADILARYGGEEFAVILPDTNEAGAAFVAAEIGRILRVRGFEHKGAESGRISVSIGLAHFGTEALHRTADLLISRADEALYAAKAAGRDRVDIWRERLSA